MFLEMYECVFKPHQLASQVDCIISQLENDYRDKRTVASIIKKLSRLVNLDQNEKNQILGRLNKMYNKPTKNLEVDETSLSVERVPGDRDFNSVKSKYSVFSSFFKCFFKDLKGFFL